MIYTIQNTEHHTLGEINDYFKRELLKTDLVKENIIIDTILQDKIALMELDRIFDENGMSNFYELDTNGMHLKKIARDTRYKYLKNDDDNAGADGRNAPVYVYETSSKGFGVSPSPDEAYTLTYNYYTKPVQLAAYDSTSAIDTVYDEIIIQGALYHFYMFRDNTDQADRAQQRFRQLINRLRTILINGQSDTMQSTMIVHGSSIGIMSNNYFRV